MGKAGLVALVAFTGFALLMMSQSSGGSSSSGATFTYRGFGVTVNPVVGGMLEASWKWRDPSGAIQTGIIPGDNLVDVTASAHAAIDYVIQEGGTPA